MTDLFTRAGGNANPQLEPVEHQITTRLAAYKRPRRLHVVQQLPRTATGKLVRSQAALRESADHDR